MKFVIHHHRTVSDHYDLMLEQDEALLSFRIAEEDIGGLAQGHTRRCAPSVPAPSVSAQSVPVSGITAIKIHDHRKDYLSYEGPVSCDRGRVEIFDSGEYRLIDSGNGFFRVCFSGKKIAGIFKFSVADSENCWTITRE